MSPVRALFPVQHGCDMSAAQSDEGEASDHDAWTANKQSAVELLELEIKQRKTRSKPDAVDL